MSNSKKSKDLPVTQAMLYSVRDELKSDIASQSLEIRSVRGEVESLKGEVKSLWGETRSLRGEIQAVRGEVEVVRGEVEVVRGEVEVVRGEVISLREDMNAKFDLVLAGMAKQDAKIHRMLTLYEEQENRNKYVLDGYHQLHRRQDQFEARIESRVAGLELVVKDLKKTT